MLVEMIGLWAECASNDVHGVTIEAHFPPSSCFVTTSLNFLVGSDAGSGLASTGIIDYHIRRPDGSQHVASFPGGYDDPIDALPPGFADNYVNRVTLALTTVNAWARAICTISRWNP